MNSSSINLSSITPKSLAAVACQLPGFQPWNGSQLWISCLQLQDSRRILHGTGTNTPWPDLWVEGLFLPSTTGQKMNKSWCELVGVCTCPECLCGDGQNSWTSKMTSRCLQQDPTDAKISCVQEHHHLRTQFLAYIQLDFLLPFPPAWSHIGKSSKTPLSAAKCKDSTSGLGSPWAPDNWNPEKCFGMGFYYVWCILFFFAFLVAGD